MCPRSIRSPCRALLAGNAPARSRMLGRTLVPVARTCRTTSIAAGSSCGRSATSLASASTPPADAPTTTTSRCRACCWLVEATRRLSHRRPGASGPVLGPAAVLQHEDLDAQIGIVVHRPRERDDLPPQHAADRLHELLPDRILEVLALPPHRVGTAALDQGELGPREAASQDGDDRPVEEVGPRLGRALPVETLVEPDDGIRDLRQQRAL